MRPDEAEIGKRVRVSASLHRGYLEGKLGTIIGRWGSPDYVALDVMLDDGDLQLFWYYELDEAENVAQP